MTEKIQFNLNGKPVDLTVDPSLTLMWVLRTNFGLTGTKFGCGLGFCGSCTVLMEDEPIRSCMLTVGDVGGSKIVTIEGLARNGSLHPIQEAFMKHDALQCGYCTPGMIMASKALIDENPLPDKDMVKEALAGNLCRCTGYHGPVKAVLKAAASLGEDSNG